MTARNNPASEISDRDFVVKELGAIEGDKHTVERWAEHLQRMASAGTNFIAFEKFSPGLSGNGPIVR